jgi:DNA polymerase I-like protein with 3'-5' exonuclease and polymerase domains
MAKGISKRARSVGPVSCQLDEQFPIDFKVVGRRDWIEERFEPDAIFDEQKIFISEPGDLADIKAWYAKQSILGEDSETTGNTPEDGLDPRSATSRIVLWQQGTEELVHLIDPALLPEFKEQLESKDHLHLLQNAVFDFKYAIMKYGIHMERMADTMLNEQLLTSGLTGTKVGLEDIARRYKPFRLISKEIRKQFIHLGARRFTRKMAYYAARDIALLFPIFREQVVELKRQKMVQAAQDEYDVIPCTAMMELGGVLIDPRILRMALTYWEQHQIDLERQIMTLYDQSLDESGRRRLFLIDGMQEVFKIKSSKDKLRALRDMGFNLSDTKRETIEENVNHPIAGLLAEYSAVMKITSTYGENLLVQIDPRTGLFYPDFRQLGSGEEEGRGGKESKDTIATGRYSSNFQQMPRKKENFAPVTDPLELSRLRITFAKSLEPYQKEVQIV